MRGIIGIDAGIHLNYKIVSIVFTWQKFWKKIQSNSTL